MKKILKKIVPFTIIFTMVPVIAVSACGKSEAKKAEKHLEYSEVKRADGYIDYNIDINYDEIFYTPTFEIENKDGEWEPYVNEKYDNRLFLYSISSIKSWLFGEDINLFQSIVHSLMVHEIYLANKELFNTFDFDDKNKNFYDSLVYPDENEGKFKMLSFEDYKRGYYNLNIKNNNLNCTISAKTNNKDLDRSTLVFINTRPNDPGKWAGLNITEIWTFSADPEECKWFSDDLKERFVYPGSEEIIFRLTNNRISSDSQSIVNISGMKKILNKEPIKVTIDENGSIYDEWFKYTNTERVIEKDFWTTFNYSSDSDIFSPEGTDNPRGINFATKEVVENPE